MAKVLLVEDDNNLREIYQARLVAEGYDIASARDGEEALVVAKQEMPDLVISDVMMPKISGFEMLDILRNTEGLKTVKVIMLTALGQSEDQTRADSLGADRYLVKSQVTLEDIVNAAHDLLSEAGAIDAPAVAAPAAQAAPAPIAAPEPVAAVDTPVAVAPAPEPAAAAPVAPAATVIPVASAPADVPEDIETVAPSMPPTPVSTIPVDDLAGTPVAADPVAVVTPEPTTAEPQSNAAESATVEAQIEDFVESQSGQPEAEVEPEATTPVAVAPEQAQAVTDALETLGVLPETEAPVAAPAPEPAAPAEEATSHKKVIEPLSDGAAVAPKSNLNDLLAAEAADDQIGAEPAAEQQPEQPAKPAAAPSANDEFDPNSIAL